MFFVEEVFYKKFIITCCWYSLCNMYMQKFVAQYIHEHVQLHATFVHDVVPNIVQYSTDLLLFYNPASYEQILFSHNLFNI